MKFGFKKSINTGSEVLYVNLQTMKQITTEANIKALYIQGLPLDKCKMTLTLLVILYMAI